MASHPPLSQEQVRDLCLILSSGCDRVTACKYVGLAVDALQALMRRNRGLADEVRQAEAKAELAHMRQIRRASEDAKQWRASTWWLEHSAPERYGGQPAKALTKNALEDLLDNLAQVVIAEISDEALRERVLAQLEDYGPLFDASTVEEF